MSTGSNSRCGFFAVALPIGISLSLYRQRADFVLVRDAAAEDRIVQLDGETRREADAALYRERAAEHGRARGQRLARAAVASDQILGRKHRRDRALLVQAPRAVLDGVGAQRQLVPVWLDFIVAPARRRDRLGAHLLGKR